MLKKRPEDLNVGEVLVYIGGLMLVTYGVGIAMTAAYEHADEIKDGFKNGKEKAIDLKNKVVNKFKKEA